MKIMNDKNMNVKRLAISLIMFFLFGLFSVAISSKSLAESSPKQVTPKTSEEEEVPLNIFIVRNEGNKPAVLKKIAVDGIVYLNSEKTVLPYDREIVYRTREIDKFGYSFFVISAEVKFFEMIVQEDGEERIYSCELIDKDTITPQFNIWFGGDSFISPLESIDVNEWEEANH